MLPQQARGTSRKHVAKHFTQDQPAAPDITCYIKQYVRLTSIAVISNFNVLGISKCKHVRAAIFSSQQSYGSNLKCPPAAFIGPLSQSVSHGRNIPLGRKMPFLRILLPLLRLGQPIQPRNLGLVYRQLTTAACRPGG